jgi:diaminopimelate decarboxylase
VVTHKSIQTGHKSSKFGINPYSKNSEFKKLVDKVIKTNHIHLTGLHLHLGSQIFDPKPYAEALTTLLTICKEIEWKPSVLSPGGGWGVPYHENTVPADPVRWIKMLAGTISDWCRNENWDLPELVIEPGRWLIARAGVSIYTVGFTKENPEGGVIAAVDGGMADNPRPALYESRYSAALIADTTLRPIVNSRIVGRYCESGDELIHNIALPYPKRGDLLAIPVSGAYQLSMASNYNLADRPCVIWLQDGNVEILQKRELACESAWWRGD